MRFAAIADIHGNSAALDAVLADIRTQGVAEIVNLGDHLSGPLDAAGTADRVMALGGIALRGNHDRALIDRPKAEMGQWELDCIDALTPAHLGWLKALPETARYRGEVYLCHGAPSGDTTYWLERLRGDGQLEPAPIEAIESEASGIDANEPEATLLLCGHTHLARAVRLRDGRLAVNPGSVGCPGYFDPRPVPHIVQSGAPHAAYAILAKTSLGWDVTFRQVPYDPTGMIALAKSAGRADWAELLETGLLTARP